MPDYFVDEKNPHLGGFKTGIHGDEATYFPELWQWLVKELGIKSVLDVGCGSGVAVKFFEGLLGTGPVTGVDGVFQPHSSIIQHDYTDGTVLFQDGQFDMIWCVEFLEHVEEKFLPNVLETINSTKAKMILLTHAFPGQAGHWHMNCREPAYWIGVLAAIGYRLDALISAQARAQAAFNQSAWNHFTRSGMVFVRNT